MSFLTFLVLNSIASRSMLSLLLLGLSLVPLTSVSSNITTFTRYHSVVYSSSVYVRSVMSFLSLAHFSKTKVWMSQKVAGLGFDGGFCRQVMLDAFLGVCTDMSLLHPYHKSGHRCLTISLSLLFLCPSFRAN